MSLSQGEYEAIIADGGKVIVEDISWTADAHTHAQKFRVEINSGYPIFVNGWYNPFSGKLSYAIIHRSVGRIYGLDLGAEHRNPDRQLIGEKHKNYWLEGHRDKWAYVPDDITEPWSRPLAVWEQFCSEANLTHIGSMRLPAVQTEMPL